MIDTTEQTRRPGRPPLYGKAMARREILICQTVDKAALALASETGKSVAEIYRDWIEAGQNATKRRTANKSG